MSRAGKAGPEQLTDGPGIAVLVIPMPGGVRPPTDDTAAMIAWLARHGAPRTGEVAQAAGPPARVAVADMPELAVAVVDVTLGRR